VEVVETAHGVGIPTTSTLMFGHVDRPVHWARHLMVLRDLQKRTGGITEFVPLPFVHMEAPLYRKGRARRGPTFEEAIKIHAVSRLALRGAIDNIQCSWVKLGPEGCLVALQSGCNDMGGTLMNESISRAAGASHGQELSPEEMIRLIRSLDRTPVQRTTLYRRMTVFEDDGDALASEGVAV
jgi:FO synthase